MKRIFKISFMLFVLTLPMISISGYSKNSDSLSLQSSTFKRVRVQYFYVANNGSLVYVYDQIHSGTELEVSHTLFVLHETYMINRKDIPDGKAVNSNITDLSFLPFPNS